MTDKKKLLIASVLKPVDDTRMYEKFAVTLAQTNKYEINIIGFSAKTRPAHPHIHFHPLYSFQRNSLKRLLASFFYAKKALQLKPQLSIVTCPELLPVSVLLRIIFGLKFCYDLQENTARNIIWSAHKPSLFRRQLAGIIKLNEYSLMRFSEYTFMAEQGYLNEYSFSVGKKHAVIENKARKPIMKDHSVNDKGFISLCFTGTILESYGIWDAIRLVERLQHSHGSLLLLKVSGHCPRPELARDLENYAQTHPWLHLNISPTPLPHQQLLKNLQASDFALIAYRLNPSNENCFPTRVWECLAHKIPMLFKMEHPWIELIPRYKCGLSLDYQEGIIDLDQARKHSYYPHELPECIYWESEENKLIQAVDQVLG